MDKAFSLDIVSESGLSHSRRRDRRRREQISSRCRLRRRCSRPGFLSARESSACSAHAGLTALNMLVTEPAMKLVLPAEKEIVPLHYASGDNINPLVLGEVEIVAVIKVDKDIFWAVVLEYHRLAVPVCLPRNGGEVLIRRRLTSVPPIPAFIFSISVIIDIICSLPRRGRGRLERTRDERTPLAPSRRIRRGLPPLRASPT